MSKMMLVGELAEMIDGNLLGRVEGELPGSVEVEGVEYLKMMVSDIPAYETNSKLVWKKMGKYMVLRRFGDELSGPHQRKVFLVLN
jgi:hypothetical protein